MTAGDFQMPRSIGWVIFTPGLLIVLASFPRLTVDGVTILGVLIATIGLWILGAFSLEGWIGDIPEDHPDALGSLDLLEREGHR